MEELSLRELSAAEHLDAAEAKLKRAMELCEEMLALLEEKPEPEKGEIFGVTYKDWLNSQ